MKEATRLKMKIGAAMLMTLCLTPSIFAEETVLPKNLPGFENLDRRELAVIQKDYVDEGHQPWRSDPIYYAKFFLNFYYPNLNPNERERLPARLALKENQATVRVIYDEKSHTIYLHRVFPSNPESIWLVDKMTVDKAGGGEVQIRG